jgi:proline dehydrogenase
MSILDFSEEGVESEADFAHAHGELLRCIEFGAKYEFVPFAVFKTTAFASTPLLEKVSQEKQPLTAEEQTEWQKVRERFISLCETAYYQGIPIMVDAEESWIQKAIDDLTMECMARFNKEMVIVINTYQLYQKGCFEFLKQQHAQAREGGFLLGAKLVRGAYMEKERARAEEKGYPSPINDTKADTDNEYNAGLRYCLENLDTVLTFAGTHNEDSNMLAANYAAEHGIPANHPNLWFGQLYGMCDHISFNLAAAGYNVAKYVPYGPVRSVTPYLIRRADENSSVAGQAGKEIALLKKEIDRRK